jgi:transcriptional regulator with XRE-family HTH domain
MKERILEFLRAENKSSAQLAEEIGVQPSGISHIVSGRNNPSLDFVLKMLDRYKYLSVEWLLFGRGDMYKDKSLQTLFDEGLSLPKEEAKLTSSSGNNIQLNEKKDIKPLSQLNNLMPDHFPESSEVVKIVWFYSNNSFDEYYPRK